MSGRILLVIFTTIPAKVHSAFFFFFFPSSLESIILLC